MKRMNNISELYKEKGDTTNKSNSSFDGADPRTLDLAEELHKVFLESMESRYKDILSFLGFIIPAFTGFLWLVNNYELNERSTKYLSTFFIGTLVVISILLWGAAYALAMSYRYRYLQASVYMIEEAFGVGLFIPTSFKPKPLVGIKALLGLSIAPGILQVHLFFFISCIIGIAAAFSILTPITWLTIVVISFSVFCIYFIYYLGALHYPEKLERILDELEKKNMSK